MPASPKVGMRICLMHKWCHSPGCSERAATRYGNYCSKHASAKRRHGDSLQKGVTKSDLKPYIELIQERRAKHPEKKAWISMEERWKAQVEICVGIANDHGPMNKYKRIAAKEIVKVGHNVEHKTVVDTVLAMYLLQELESRRFRSDLAFWTQLVRRVRGLTELNSGMWVDPKTLRRKTAAMELCPRAAEAMVFYIKQALGVCGLWLAAFERKEEERRRQDALNFFAELKELA
ncbi:hypothetical protein [Methylobacterium iners]|uniref:Uncharacterized protein n=1 Tax=Methylobacterium iners TaxID=418707 RepID=A0ABQ4RTR7_9HYPH|nr:hypothetical protein [Methylobacterium iners]GJD92982.1 hypothetical protein OCOJLMKI_0167 [Methylobacterium iners]